MGKLNVGLVQSLGFIGAQVFIETGTQDGKRLRRVCHLFPEVHTIEIDPALHESARRLLRRKRHVHCHLGDSAEVLPRILDAAKSTAIYLDAHYVSGCSGDQQRQCPLIAELAAILSVPWTVPPMIAIDDSQFFYDWAWRRGWNNGYDRAQFPTLTHIEQMVSPAGYAIRQVARALLLAHEAHHELEGTASR